MQCIMQPIARIKEALALNPKGLSITELSDLLGLHRNATAHYLEILQLRGDADAKKSGTAKNFFPVHRMPVSALLHFCLFPAVVLDNRLDVAMVNDPALELLGCTLDVLYGEPATRVPIPLFTAPALAGRYHETLHGKPGTATVRTLLKGRMRSLNVHLLPVVFDTGREGCALVIMDETERQNADAEVHRWQKRYEALAGGMREWAVRLLPDMTILSASESYAAHVGRTIGELAGFRFTPILSPEDRIRIRQVIATLAPERPAAMLEVRTFDAEGRVRREEWEFTGIFSGAGTCKEVHATGRDVTYLRQLEAELGRHRAHLEAMIQERTCEMQDANRDLLRVIAEKEEIERELTFTQFAFDHASDSILLFDRAGFVYKANTTASEILGYSAEAFRTTTVFTINPSITRTAWERMWEDAVPGKKERVASIHRTKSGIIIDVEVSRTFVRFGDTMYFCSIARERSPES
ncbi:MAG: PAS domain S-box protein [Methanomicrobiales archaeon]|nr:PAS domain S-box protein [Methanomicrobiales archaeon]